MAADKANAYLDHGPSDESDSDAGYDSEAAEISKTSRRATKRRKVDHDNSDDEGDSDSGKAAPTPVARSHLSHKDEDEDPQRPIPSEPSISKDVTPEDTTTKETSQQPAEKSASKSKSKKANKSPPPPGVVYLSSLPPYLKPSALRNLLLQRGFHPITRLFLAPVSKHKSTSRKNSRQLYSEGWIEFASKKTARLCAETLNAQPVGGKKGGFYHDDIWNMKYLRGMRWEELMAGVREEKREVEGRRDEERRTIMKETKAFVEGVEEGRRLQGMKRKKEKQAKATTGDVAPNGDEVKRMWRQFDVHGSKDAGQQRQDKDRTNEPPIADDVRQVLGKIF
ncbi:hypothetical protein PV10_03776 [Exophiala mesophila]|uniref:Pre-rRNA-processing protein ESF2 n=1 Tax=Exophiala mesophila TaxID=212818 RepID=A0A0D1ZCS8_EXOME|nr:uncharacterized protein PV10_03776 [Exophiala mesophila]KIV92482.1 hypothetical protein PV10_03776 [Exophiala mesophila]